MQCITQRKEKGPEYRVVWDTRGKYTGKGDFNDTTSLGHVIQQETFSGGFLLVCNEQRGKEHIAKGERNEHLCWLRETETRERQIKGYVQICYFPSDNV